MTFPLREKIYLKPLFCLKDDLLGVVSPHLPGEIFRAILVNFSLVFSQLESILVVFFPRLHSILVNFIQLQSALINFSQV